MHPIDKETAMPSCADARWMMFIGSAENAVRDAVIMVISAANPEALGDRRGGYFCLKILGADGFLIRPMLAGEVTNGKDEKYVAFCQEKALRLEAEHAAHGHVSSWQSRDPEHDKWGGAVLGPDDQKRQYAFSFSGLPELCDEAVMLLTAVQVGHLTKAEAIEIARISNNTFFMHLSDQIPD